MVKDFKQYDGKWGNKILIGSNTYQAVGCCPTSCADIIYEINKEITPEITSNWLLKNGYILKNQGTVWGGIKQCIEHFGMKCDMLNTKNLYGYTNTTTEKKWRENIRSKGYYGILLMGKGNFTNGGHYIVISDYDSKKGYYVLDPASSKRTGWHIWGDFKGQVKIFYLIEKIEENNDEYYKKCNKKYKSLIDGLESINVDWTFENRKKIASKNNINNYKGTYNQNSTLLKLLKQGKLKK